MNRKMKLCLLISSLLCTALYSAEKPTIEECWTRMYSEFLEKTDNGNPEKIAQLQQAETERCTQEIAASFIKHSIRTKQLVTPDLLMQADQETATLAHQHNQNLQQQLLNQDQK